LSVTWYGKVQLILTQLFPPLFSITCSIPSLRLFIIAVFVKLMLTTLLFMGLLNYTDAADTFIQRYLQVGDIEEYKVVIALKSDRLLA